MRVFGSDHERLGDEGEQWIRFDGIRAYMRMTDGHCSALSSESSSGRLVCLTYATRPQVCRDLERGSGACQGELDQKSERPLLALRLCK